MQMSVRQSRAQSQRGMPTQITTEILRGNERCDANNACA